MFSSRFVVGDVEPTNDPGVMVLKTRCNCLLRDEVERKVVPVVWFCAVAVVSSQFYHHHVFKVSEELWRGVSEARGWPQRRYTLSAFVKRTVRLAKPGPDGSLDP